MLDLLRGFSKGWTAKILIGLLIASFAIWGISGSILFGNANTVAQVGDTTITAQQYRAVYDNQLNVFSQQVGRRLTRQQADAFGLRNNVLALVTAGAVLDENAKSMGLGISQEELAKSIANDPGLRDFSGQVDPEAIKRTLRNRGISQDEFETERRRSAIRRQLEAGIIGNLDAPKAYLDAISTYQNEARVFDYVAVGAEVLEKTPEPTDGQVAEFFEETKTNYTAPEYRKLTILKLQAADLSKPQEITDDEIRTAYDARKNGLQTPEQRRVEQLVLKDKAEADNVKEKLAAGTSFDDIVTELGKTIKDIDLGLLTKPELPDTKVADAAFSAELNKPTDIVEGLFGSVIVRVSEIVEQKVTPFNELKEQIRNELALERAADEVFTTFDAVEDERAAGSNLTASAKAANLKTQTITKIDSQGRDENGNAVADIPALAQLLNAAFESQPGDDTREIPIGSDGFLWYEVEDIIPSRQKEFNEVKSDVKTAWITQETATQVLAVAEGIAERVRKGEDMNAVLADALPADSVGGQIKYETSKPLKRQDQEPKIGAGPIAEGFQTPKGEIAVAPANGGNFVIMRVADVQAPEGDNIPEDLLAQFNASSTEDVLNQVVQDMQSKLDVSINQAGIEAAFNPYAGGGGHGGY